jgi:Cys-tRNA(Pro) deacylase
VSKKPRHPVTRAIHALRKHGVDLVPHLYDYVDRGGTRASSEALGIDEHRVIKTLIFEDDRGQPLVVLMHGDRQVSGKALARQIGAKSVRPCEPAVADRHSGYQVGGTSPFGTRRQMPVYMERTIGDLDRIVINGGSRGFLVEIATADLVRVLEPTPVDAATD